MWSDLITGKRKKGTRFHNHQARLMDAAAVVNLPASILTTVFVKLTRRYPELPLLSFKAIRRLNRMIQKDWKILEFGSGMSTLWFARRCELVVSVEINSHFYELLKTKLANRKLENVDYRLRTPDVAHVVPEYPDSYFDFVLVDGVNRHLAMETALAKVKPGGFIYLDNIDSPQPDYQKAREMLISAAAGDGNISIFNDLTPSRVYVTEGMLAQVTNEHPQ